MRLYAAMLVAAGILSAVLLVPKPELGNQQKARFPPPRSRAAFLSLSGVAGEDSEWG